MRTESRLDILSQRDLLSLGTKAAVKHEFGKTQDGIGVVTEMFDSEGAGCRQLVYFGRVGAFQVNVITIGRSFLLRTIDGDHEWTALLSDFRKSALRAVAQLAEGLGGPQGGIKKPNYFRIHYLTNLELSADREADEGFVRKVRERLAPVHEAIDHAIGDLVNVPLASKENRTWTGVAHTRFIEETLDKNDIDETLQSYGRYIFDFSGPDHTLVIHPARLAGIHGVSERSGLLPVKMNYLTPRGGDITEDVLAELAVLVNNSQTKERDLQQYFERQPALLCEGQEYRIYPQVELAREDGSVLRPDFLLEPLDPASGKPAIILDLKLPSEKIVLHQKNRNRMYAKLHEYVAQMREYASYFDSPTNRRSVVEALGLSALRPRLVLVVGKDYEERDSDVVGSVLQSSHPVEVKTYDDLLRFGKGLVEGGTKVAP